MDNWIDSLESIRKEVYAAVIADLAKEYSGNPEIIKQLKDLTEKK